MAAVYVVAHVAASAAARNEVRAVAAAQGIVAEDVMVAPDGRPIRSAATWSS